MELLTGLSSIQQTYFQAQARLRSYRKVIESVSFLDPSTEEVCFLSGHASLTACLKRTILGLYWTPGMTGGRDSYLCQADVMALEGLIVEHAGDMKCISICEALVIAHCLRQARQEKAITLLRSIGSDGLAEDLMSQSIARPDQSWLTHFCQSIGVAIMTHS
jgi:hypothetical protein